MQTSLHAKLQNCIKISFELFKKFVFAKVTNLYLQIPISLLKLKTSTTNIMYMIDVQDIPGTLDIQMWLPTSRNKQNNKISMDIRSLLTTRNCIGSTFYIIFNQL